MRLAFIEAHLAVHGYIGRGNFLDCASSTATKALAQYKELHPGVLVYSEVAKRYTCTATPSYHLKIAAGDFLAAYNLLFGHNK